jgi:hypothetical protein
MPESNNNRLLSEFPNSKDELGDLHEKIAKTIACIINDNSYLPEQEQVIGLFGEWGSGKSTVVKILEKNNLDTFEVFTFNSWLHKDDFLNRAFLLEFCNKFNVCNKIYKKEDLTTLKNNEITFKDYISSQININKKIPIGLNSGLKFIFACIIVILYFIFLPLNFTFVAILLLLILFIVIPNSEFFIMPFFTKRIDISSNIMSKSFDFTNYDFENIFKEIINNTEKQKIILINLEDFDRLTNKDILKALNLFQILSRITKAKNNIWILLPISDEKLNLVLKFLYPEYNEKNVNLIDYQKRLIPYNINIPNIDITDWESFFKNKFKEIFNSLFDNEKLNNIISIFDAVLIDSANQLTPRFIINYINELKINYIFWNNNKNLTSEDQEFIKIEFQALYVAIYLFKKELIDTENFIKNDKTIITKYISPKLYNNNIQNIYKSLLIQKYKTFKINHILNKDLFISKIKKGDVSAWSNIDDLFKYFKIDKTDDQKKNNIIRRYIAEALETLTKEQPQNFIIDLGNIGFVLNEFNITAEEEIVLNWKNDFIGLCIPYLNNFFNEGQKNSSFIGNIFDNINILSGLKIIMESYDSKKDKEKFKKYILDYINKIIPGNYGSQNTIGHIKANSQKYFGINIKTV